MTVEPMWKMAVRRGIEALDWKVQRYGDEMSVVSRVARSLEPQQLVKAAYAAHEIDKLVEKFEAFGELHLADASKARSHMANLMMHDGLKYDRVLSAKAAYRLKLADAMWEQVKEDPADKIDALASAPLDD